MTKKTNIHKNLSALAKVGQQVESKVAQNDKESEYSRLITQAEKLYDNNRNKEAIEKYEKALEIKPDDKHCKEQISLIKKKTYHTTATRSKPEPAEEKGEMTENVLDTDKQTQNIPEEITETKGEKNKNTIEISSDDYYSMFSQDEIDIDCRTVSIKLNRELHNALMERVIEAKRNVRGASLFNVTNNTVREFLRKTDEIYEKSMKRQLKNKPY